jgi:hypothetical protein
MRRRHLKQKIRRTQRKGDAILTSAGLAPVAQSGRILRLGPDSLTDGHLRRFVGHWEPSQESD